MFDLIKRYEDLKYQERGIKRQIESVEAAIWLEAKKQCPQDKMKVETDLFKVKITPVLYYHVDQRLASGITVDVWKIKRELDKYKYDLIEDTDRKIVDTAITTKPGKPKFEVELKGAQNE